MYMCFYNILTMCSRLSANEMLINHHNAITTSEINDCINTSLTFNLEHIVKVLQKNRNMEGAYL